MWRGMRTEPGGGGDGRRRDVKLDQPVPCAVEEQAGTSGVVADACAHRFQYVARRSYVIQIGFHHELQSWVLRCCGRGRVCGCGVNSAMEEGVERAIEAVGLS
jgi:hypothetical protein